MDITTKKGLSNGHEVIAKRETNPVLPSEKASQATDNMQIVSAGGVPDGKWMVAIVKRNTEKSSRDKLLESGHEAYVATQRETRVYQCRKRKEIDRVIITSVVFIRTTEQERLRILRECPFIHYFMTNKAGHTNDFGRHPFVIIPDHQMAQLRFMLYNADAPVNFTDQPLRLGDHIRVIRGKLAGFEGQIVRASNTSRIGIQLDFLGCALVEIPQGDLEKIA